LGIYLIALTDLNDKDNKNDYLKQSLGIFAKQNLYFFKNFSALAQASALYGLTG
jgi:hypothetical protein